MKKISKIVSITIALTAIGVAVRAILKINKKLNYLDYFTQRNFVNLDKYLKNLLN